MPAAEPGPAEAAPATSTEAVIEESASAEAEGEGEGPDWRPSYEANLAKWREEADHARAHAEATRAAFEAEHAAAEKAAADAEKEKKAAEKAKKEAEENEARLAAELADEAPRAGPIHKRIHAEDRSLKVKEAWELVGARKVESQSQAPPSATSVTASQWEEISAPHSSVEDISAATTSAPQSAPSSQDKDAESSSSPAASPAAASSSLAPVPAAAAPATITTPSLTLSLFTAPNGLTVSRVLAALGINLLLPFINGIMLGLGEITAREGVRITRLWWKGERAIFGHWRRKDSGVNSATSVGLSGSGGF